MCLDVPVRCYRRVHGGRLAGPQLPQSQVAGHGVQPWPQPVTVTQLVQADGGDHESVVHHVRGIGLLAQ